MEVQSALDTQVAVVLMQTHRQKLQSLELVVQVLLAVTDLVMVAVAVVELAALVLHVEMDLHQLQQHLQAVLE
jgi:cell division protein FtsL